MIENSEKKNHSQERVKSTERRSSSSFKSFASTVAATEKVKRSSVSGRQKQEPLPKSGRRSQSKNGRGSAEQTGENAIPKFVVFPPRFILYSVRRRRPLYKSLVLISKSKW